AGWLPCPGMYTLGCRTTRCLASRLCGGLCRPGLHRTGHDSPGCDRVDPRCVRQPGGAGMSTPSLKGLGEFGLIRALTQSLKPGRSVLEGIGDDCAVIEVGSQQVLLTCDASLEDIHFKRNWGRPEDLGWKAAVSA